MKAGGAAATTVVVVECASLTWPPYLISWRSFHLICHFAKPRSVKILSWRTRGLATMTAPKTVVTVES